jgi:carbonic anhydrase/acetyltransferase-like protein (isoleucine patch superfamily)
MNRNERRRSLAFFPTAEPMEPRLVLSASPRILAGPFNFHPIRPNTPVLPYGAASTVATFIDTTAQIKSGKTIVVNAKTYIAPYARLDGTGGFLKIGQNSAIQDSAVLVANPNHVRGNPGIVIGNGVVVGNGARVLGNSTIGAFGAEARPTAIGANAVIDGAVIQAGAIVGPLARVGPGVTVPSGFRVLPGANVTTDAQASNPALGKVVAVTQADTGEIQRQLSQNAARAGGYATLYQGDPATGNSPGGVGKGVYNGSLAPVEGASPEPGTAGRSPTFPSPRGHATPARITRLRGRIIGNVNFASRVQAVAHALGRGDSIRADEGQPINIGLNPRFGDNVSITTPLSGGVTIGRNFVAGNHSVVLGGPAKFGDDVTLGDSAVVSRSILGNNVTIGASAYVAQSNIPDGVTIPNNAIIINNVRVGMVGAS